MNESQLFLRTLKFATEAQRQAYLETTCRDDAELRRGVESLLKAHTMDPNFLETSMIEHADWVVVADRGAGQAGAQIGAYRLIEPIGEGGMGMVYKAEQTEPVRRTVALKIIKPGMDSRQIVARFKVEQQTLALMDHINIARVLDAGTTELGQPYFVMELVDGVPLTQYCDEHRLSPLARIELFVPVCLAIQHAHQKGVIHRDIKPSNVMVTLCDGKPVPKVIDFGVAKATEQQLTQQSRFTLCGTMVGTLEYMSPEQAEWSERGVDTRSDIYSLGALLYQLLTGSTPLIRQDANEAGLIELIRVIREQEPPRPSTRLSQSADEDLASIAALRQSEPGKLIKLLRGELDWIVMKTLEKDRSRRYETAIGFAADLKRYLADEPVQACPPSAAYRFGKFARRNKVALATTSVMALALLLALAAFATSNVLIARAYESEIRSKEELRVALERERHESYFQRIALVQRKLAEDDLGGALTLLEACPKDLRRWEWHYLQRLCRVDPLVLSYSCPVTSVAFSHDGKRLIGSYSDGTVNLWDRVNGQLVQSLRAHPELAYSVAFHPSGRFAASVGERGCVKVWDLSTASVVFESRCDAVHSNGAAYTVAMSPDGQWLAVGNDGVVHIWDWQNKERVRTFSGHEKRAISVVFSPNGRQLATGSWGGSIKLWDLFSDRDPVRTFATEVESRHPVVALAFDQLGSRLATASFGRRVDIWDTRTGQLQLTIPHKGLVLGVAFSSDGDRLASCGEDKTVRIWEATSGREILSFRDHRAAAGCVRFSSDGTCLASASTDGTIRVWDGNPHPVKPAHESLTFIGHTNEVWSLAISPDGQQVASGGWSMPVKIWEVDSGRENREIPSQQVIDFCVAWQPDGKCLAVAGRDGPAFTVKVFRTLDGSELFALPPGPEYLCVTYSPDGRYLITGRANRQLQSWNATTGEHVADLGTHAREIRTVVFSRDGRQLASASDDGTVKLWDAARLESTHAGARLTVAAWIPGPSSNVAFSPDGRRLATGGADHAVSIWDTQTGEPCQVLRGHRGSVYALSFSPDPSGRWVASAGEDSTVKIWNSHTGMLVHSFRGHLGLVCALSFTPDGRRLVSGSRDHTVKVWDVAHLLDDSMR